MTLETTGSAITVMAITVMAITVTAIKVRLRCDYGDSLPLMRCMSAAPRPLQAASLDYSSLITVTVYLMRSTAGAGSLASRIR